MKSQICRNIKNSGNATAQLFVFHMDGVTQTGFCWSVINEWGESSKWHPVTSFTILGYRLLMAVKLYVCWDAVYSGE